MKIIKREKIFEGHYSLHIVELETAKGKEKLEREQFETPNSVGVLVHDTQHDEIVLVQQFRVGPEKELLEIVAGKIEGKDKDPERTARREVMEEVGYEIDELTLWCEFHTCPGPVTEQMSLFYAKVSKQVADGGGLAIEHEEIEVIKMKRQDFLKAAFYDAKTLIAQGKLQQLA